MKVVILAGGKGTRISEESLLKPKPMVEIGGIPILVHIMRYFSSFGHNEFIVCAGYKGNMIKDFFNNYYTYMTDATFDLRNNHVTWHQGSCTVDPWTVTVANTGEESMTGGRLKRIRKYLDDAPFFMTYGDGLADVDLHALEAAYKQSGLLSAVTAVQPPGRFGRFAISDNQITGFIEKPAGDGDWINGGYFILDPKVLDRVDGDACVWEEGPMTSLANEGQLLPFFHDGFWQPMDTLRDKMLLERIWESGEVPWDRSDC
ncbi:glucose-1-phosphate cytidylyltransferase [uncultured Pseudodesulfovibrio sp.]|uniref:glucose-1-phosphate cytidylyltransferase n=1 Tax=uncultured Pseudodesulfovibrio sp. TaxID=2035858 RepID=UPI0029C626A9|nr:glucose-1-phosphate cytidylyltransferase [uncultured Pseudodesulfovibrio sp.]